MKSQELNPNRNFPKNSNGVKKWTFVLPTAPHPDTLVAIFIFKKFGEKLYPGIKEAGFEFWQELPKNKTTESLEKENYILIDIGGGKFDHHNKKEKTTTSLLVAEHLGVIGAPALAKMLEYARRDDFFGKGTISEDPIDRAFGLSALIYHLNKSLVKSPERVVEIVMPLLIAHYNEEYRRAEELPLEFKSKTEKGESETFDVKQKGKKLKVVMIKSDNPSLTGYLRSITGGKFDVVLQQQSTGHMNILTRPAKRIDLRSFVSLVRLREAERQNSNLEMSASDLSLPGRLPGIKEWYYDRATNSLQNGGLNPKEIPPTKISWNEMKKLLELGLSEQIISF